MGENKKLVFLLGGHDLEMIEIRNLLIEKVEKYFDYDLSWGAGLSNYKSVFNDSDIFVGIELLKDCIPPVHYIEIDHHNEKSDLPASIEQIAELLKVDLSRWQKLVAANDKFYIPGLAEMNASHEEINEIRYLDRKAQGVTDEDEALGEKSIRQNISKEKDFIIIRSLTPKFSTITDRLFPFRKLLIYNDRELTYYGEGIPKLFHAYSDLIIRNLAFSGGGDNGFFGIKKEGLKSNDEIKNEIEKIKSIILNEKRYTA